MPKLMEKRYCYSKEKSITLWQEKWFYSKSYFFFDYPSNDGDISAQ